jgi:alanine dehydrogenase
LPFVKTLAAHGAKETFTRDPHLKNGANVHAGAITHKAVAHALGLPYQALV